MEDNTITEEVRIPQNSGTGPEVAQMLRVLADRVEQGDAAKVTPFSVFVSEKTST